MSTVMFIVTIPTEEEEVRLKNKYITKILESKLQKSETRATLLEQRGSVVLDIDPLTPTTSQASKALNRPKSESDNLVNLDEMCYTDMLTHGPNDPCSSKSINETDSSYGTKSSEGIREKISSKSKLCKTKDADLELTIDAPMELVLRKILTKFEIENAIWTKNLEDKMLQVIFHVEVNKLYEILLEKFHEWGIGDREGSSVSVINCITSKTFSKSDDSESETERESKFNAAKESAWERFMDSVKSRLNVAQIVNNVRQDATITFDFCVLIISASIMAAFGLVDDSTIFLAASMLISPLMGPIIAAIFGTVIKDSSLQKLGLKNELIGICLAVSVGFVFGLISCAFDNRYSLGDGMSTEMLSRCDKHSLLVGIFTAIPSGAAAAVGILGGNIGSLVGVAISASLLPPAVNTGVLWALACVYKFFETDATRYNRVIKTTTYSQNQATELAILGSISMCLTLINIVCIYAMGILMFKIKEIAPAIMPQKRSAWQRDIKIARNLKRADYSTDQAIMDEFSCLPSEEQQVLGLDTDLIRNMQTEEATYQYTWSPLGFSHLVDRFDDDLPTVNRLERLYSTIQYNQQATRRRHCSMYQKFRDRPNEGAKPYRRFTDHVPKRCSRNPELTSVMKAAVLEVSPSPSILHSDVATTPTGSVQQRRKFIVTPAHIDLEPETNSSSSVVAKHNNCDSNI